MEKGGAGRSHITRGLIGPGYLQDPVRKQQKTQKGWLRSFMRGLFAKECQG